MRVLFIYPNLSSGSSMPQVGISSLSACLKQAGHEVDLLDFTYLDLDHAEDHLVRKLKESDPHVVAISIRSLEWDFVKTRILPTLAACDLPVIVGGPHPTAAPDEVMAQSSIYALARGEGEESLLELVDQLEEGKLGEKVQGCWVRKNDEIIKSDARRLLEDLDSLPFPDWDIWDKRHFLASHGEIFGAKDRRFGPLECSRGCPYACPYCISPTLHDLYRGKGKYHRDKSVERIIAEAADKKDRFDINYFHIVDETFMLRDSRVEEFCRRWKQEVDVPFFFTTRPETVTEDRIRWVAEAGADIIALGIESGDPDYRKQRLNRGYSQEKLFSAVKIIKSHNIKVFGFFVMGMPYENRETIEKTFQLIRKLDLEYYTISLCYPFKGTPFYDVALKEGMLDSEHKGPPNVWQDTPLSLPGLPRERLIRLRHLISYFADKSPKWDPLMRLCENNAAAYNAWWIYRRAESKILHNDIK